MIHDITASKHWGISFRTHLLRVVVGERVCRSGGGSEGGRGDDFSLLQLDKQLLASAMQVIQTGLRAVVWILPRENI